MDEGNRISLWNVLSIHVMKTALSRYHFLLYLRTPILAANILLHSTVLSCRLADVAFSFISRGGIPGRSKQSFALRAKRDCERASNTLDLIAYVSRPQSRYFFRSAITAAAARKNYRREWGNGGGRRGGNETEKERSANNDSAVRFSAISVRGRIVPHARAVTF